VSRVFGRNAIEELLHASPGSLTSLLLARGRLRPEDEPVLHAARDLGLPVREVDPDDLRRDAGGRGGVRLAADVRLAPPLDPTDLRAEPGMPDPPLLLALDGVTDPHNLGAVVRSAAAAGAHAVLVPKDRAAPLNDAAVRASAGAVAHVPVSRVTNLARTLRELRDRGFWAIATAAGEGNALWDADLRGPLVLVLGAEGTGLRPGVRSACDLAVHLPLPGPVRSLNVSVFAGVVLAEAIRQRLGGRPR
jgi:23S rRNA (guanosine2251-2'-O)-methyltransferase